jgi:hypothetical protein
MVYSLPNLFNTANIYATAETSTHDLRGNIGLL